MNSDTPYLLISKLLATGELNEGRSIIARVLNMITHGDPVDAGNHLLAYPVISPKLPAGTYYASIRFGAGVDSVEVRADVNHPTMKRGTVAYGPVDMPEEVNT